MIKKLVGLAALGGFLYAHKKRGGTLTMDSFKDTARGLFDNAKSRARQMKTDAEAKLADVRDDVRDEFASAQNKAGNFGDNVTGYGSSGYGYGSDTKNR